MPYTQVTERVWQCNDCGAHAGSPRDVKHHGTCKPGESKKWEEIYENANAWIDCNWFEVIDCDEDTQKIYHAVCSMPSTCWPNCASCTDRKAYKDVVAEVQEADALGVCTPTVLMRSNSAVLMPSDVEILIGSINRRVRINPDEDAEVKRLYHMWESL